MARPPPNPGPTNPNASASAFVDPYFSLSSNLLDRGYSIVTSDGIGNSPVAAPGPVPGAGLLSLAFLVIAGVWTKARGFLAR